MTKYKYKSTPNYTSAIIVVHGDSEKIIAKHIQSNLRLNMEFHKRGTSIQIGGLLHELETNYGSIAMLKKKSNLELDIEKGIIRNFKIFTLMDTDDCKDEKERDDYITGAMFAKYGLKDYIVPIYTTPDLEEVMYSAGLISHKFSDKEKVKGYENAFPVAKNFDENSKGKLKAMAEKLKKNQKTNLSVFIEYCLEQAEKRSIRRS